MELKDRGIRVNSLSPGATDTPIIDGQFTSKEQADAAKAELKDNVRADPLVQAVLTRFPGAEIVDVRAPGATSESSDEMPSDLPDPSQNESDFDA